MPTETHRFATPAPIDLHVRSHRGTVRVVAGPTAETTVEVSGPDGPQPRVEASADGHTVTVDVPRHRWLGSAPRYDIVVHLPADSALHVENAAASVMTQGPLAQADVRTASGAVAIEQLTGDVDVLAASGEVRLGTIGGGARLKSASGDLQIATAGGPCNARSASGAIDIGWANADVSAKSASGDITVRDAVRGALTLQATSGDVAVGVRKGTLVWLDLATVSGRTVSNLTPDGPPANDLGATLVLSLQTVSGNITVTPSVPSG